MIVFDDFCLLVCIVDVGNFFVVVCQFGWLFVIVSVVFKCVEIEFGVCLFECIMCSMWLIEVGQCYLGYVRQVFEVLDEGVESLGQDCIELFGFICIVVILDLG